MQQVCVSISFTRFAKGNSMAMKFINEAAFDSMYGPNNYPLPQNVLSGARYDLHIFINNQTILTSLDTTFLWL